MPAPRLRPALALAVVTVLVWTTRIRNIWTDDDLSVAGQVGRTALALSFTAFAIATIGACWASRRDPAGPVWARPIVLAFAAWTTGVWVVRGVQIALADHGVAFVVVHTVLAVGSIALAVWAARAVVARAGPAARPGLDSISSPAGRAWPPGRGR